MMIFMHVTFQSIFLSVAFGVGYWLLITANSQEDGLKNLGKALGGILITLSIIFAMFSLYYSIKFSEEDYVPVGGVHSPTIDNEISPENAEKQTLQKHRNDMMDDNNSDNSQGMEDALPENENKGMSVPKDKEDND